MTEINIYIELYSLLYIVYIYVQGRTVNQELWTASPPLPYLRFQSFLVLPTASFVEFLPSEHTSNWILDSCLCTRVMNTWHADSMPWLHSLARHRRHDFMRLGMRYHLCEEATSAWLWVSSEGKKADTYLKCPSAQWISSDQKYTHSCLSCYHNHRIVLQGQ